MWIEKLVGDLGDKKKFTEYKARLKALPAPYRETGAALERYLMFFGPTSDGQQLVQMLADLVEMLEQAVADEVPVRTLVGDEPVEFVETFLANYDGGSWIAKERERLAESIDKALS